MQNRAVIFMHCCPIIGLACLVHCHSEDFRTILPGAYSQTTLSCTVFLANPCAISFRTVAKKGSTPLSCIDSGSLRYDTVTVAKKRVQKTSMNGLSK